MIIITTIMYWLISGGVLFLLRQMEIRHLKRLPSDENFDMVYYEQELGRNRAPARAAPEVWIILKKTFVWNFIWIKIKIIYNNVLSLFFIFESCGYFQFLFFFHFFTHLFS